MLGCDEEYAHSLERAYHAYLDAGDVASAARCVWWIGHGQSWRARASKRLVRAWTTPARGAGDCVARGYLAIPVVFEHSSRGDYTAAHHGAVVIAEIAERFGDSDPVTLAMMEQASALLRLRRRDEGLRLVDETMLAVSAGELPIVAGIVYCNTIAFAATSTSCGRRASGHLHQQSGVRGSRRCSSRRVCASCGADDACGSVAGCAR